MLELGNADRWQRTLSLIAASSSVPGEAAARKLTSAKTRSGTRPSTPPCAEHTEVAANSRVVKVLERRSSKTVAVCWRDATSGHYAEQVWTLGVARARAVCVLTGAPIARGDAIYRPRHCRAHVPINAEATILASTLNMTLPG